MNKVEIFFDGACHNKVDKNCPMGLGIAVFIDDMYCENLSRAICVIDNQDDGTSNIAEWLALCSAMEVAKALRKHYQGRIKIFGDSKIIVNQFNMIWRMNNDKFRKYFNIARNHNHIAKVGDIIWIPRERNTKADELSKLGLQQFVQRRYQIKGRHNESDSKWNEYQSDYISKVYEKFEQLTESDDHGQTYQIWDTLEKKEVFYNKK